MNKVIEKIQIVADRYRHTPNIIGYTSGVFDLFHHGHRQFLESCKTHCDILFVGVDDDSVVTHKKGHGRPHERIAVRLENVLNTGFVNEAFVKIISSDKLLALIRPHKYFIPHNRELSILRHQLLCSMSIELIIVPYTEGISTSIIIQQMAACKGGVKESPNRGSGSS